MKQLISLLSILLFFSSFYCQEPNLVLKNKEDINLFIGVTSSVSKNYKNVTLFHTNFMLPTVVGMEIKEKYRLKVIGVFNLGGRQTNSDTIDILGGSIGFSIGRDIYLSNRLSLVPSYKIRSNWINISHSFTGGARENIYDYLSHSFGIQILFGYGLKKIKAENKYQLGIYVGGLLAPKANIFEERKLSGIEVGINFYFLKY